MKKIEPAVQKAWFVLPSWDGVTSTTSRHYIDLSQVASLLNRRFYRQGLNWAVAGFKIHIPNLIAGVSLATNPPISISKLPNTWVLANSWVKSMETWRRMLREFSDESESIRPRFEDFKIYADNDHHERGFDDNLLPLQHQPGEWEPSKIVYPDTDGTDGANLREIVAIGASHVAVGASGYRAVGMIEGYAASRALPSINDPNIPDDAQSVSTVLPENWMQAIFNEGTEQTAQVIQDFDENNQNPYPYENSIDPTTGLPFTDTMYPGGANQAPLMEPHALRAVTDTTVSNTLHFEGGNFPCGLIRIDNVNRYEDAEGNTVNVDYILEIEFVPGPHRGYLCEPMREM